jgi:glycosyltransferase involved in cell wall biosynthesis
VNFDDQSTCRVSFVGATKNRVDILRNKLTRIGDLIGPDDEVVIVDGDSTDETVQMLSTSKQVDVWISEPDKDATHAFNKGLLLASGRYLIPFSDDDELLKNGVELAVSVLDNHPNVDVIVCGGTKIGGNGPFPRWLPAGTNYGSRITDPWVYGASGVGFVIRRSALAKIGLFEPRLASDAEFIAKAITRSATVKFARIHLYIHSIVGTSHVAREFDAHLRDSRAIARAYMSFRTYWRMRLGLALTTRHTVLGRSARYWRRTFSGGWRKIRRRPYIAANSYPISELLDPDSRHWDGGFS